MGRIRQAKLATHGRHPCSRQKATVRSLGYGIRLRYCVGHTVFWRRLEWRSYILLFTHTSSTNFQRIMTVFASIPEVVICFHDFQVRPDPGATIHRKCKTSLLLFSTGNVLHVEENFTTFLPKSFNFCTKKCLTIKFCASLGRKPRPDVECGPEEECDEEENTEGEASGSTEVQIVSIQI
jgi:hypothetical protein